MDVMAADAPGTAPPVTAQALPRLRAPERARPGSLRDSPAGGRCRWPRQEESFPAPLDPFFLRRLGDFSFAWLPII